jgi:hypothetical protein
MLHRSSGCRRSIAATLARNSASRNSPETSASITITIGCDKRSSHSMYSSNSDSGSGKQRASAEFTAQAAETDVSVKGSREAESMLCEVYREAGK